MRDTDLKAKVTRVIRELSIDGILNFFEHFAAVRFFRDRLGLKN